MELRKAAKVSLKRLDEDLAIELRRQAELQKSERLFAIGKEDSPLPGLAHHLSVCKKQKQVVAANVTRPLQQKRILLLHHLTREVLATIEAYRLLGASHITAQFAGYNANAAEVYGPHLRGIPSEELRACKISMTADAGFVIDQELLQWSGGHFPTQAFDQCFKGHAQKYCSRALGCWLVLRMLAECQVAGEQLVIVEDGGYVAPLFNSGALSGDAVASFRTKHGIPADPETDSLLPPLLADAIAQLEGTVEHTRNGYDEVQAVALEFGRLAKPMFTIAISYAKTQVESRSVATTCVNAVENAMFSHGAVLRARHTCVLGSRGNIGGRLLDMLCERLDTPAVQLTGIDIKVGQEEDGPMRPPWQRSPFEQGAVAARFGVLEYTSFRDMPVDVRRHVDFIFGVTGGRHQVPGTDKWEDTLIVADVEFWLCEGVSSELWLASGSTKTEEFQILLNWVTAAVEQGSFSCEGYDGVWTVRHEDLADALSQRDYGSVYVFQQGVVEKRLLVVCDWRPANFLFYGVPTEDIDIILAQLVDVTLALCRNSPVALLPRVHAVDYSPVATNGIIGCHGKLDHPLPLPLPGYLLAPKRSTQLLELERRPTFISPLAGSFGTLDKHKMYIENLKMQPLSSEGGYFAETYRSEHECQDSAGSTRKILTIIYYMISKDLGGINFLHYNKSDIIHFFIDGWPAEYTLVSPDGEIHTHILGRDVERGQVPQLICPAGWLKTARMLPDPSLHDSLSEQYHSTPFSLICESVAPGFDFSDRHVPNSQEVQETFPALWERLRPFVSPDVDQGRRKNMADVEERQPGDNTEFVIHLARQSKWEHDKNGGEYTLEVGESFVHASPDMECAVVVANAFYKKVHAPFVFLKIAVGKVTAPVIFEDPSLPEWLDTNPDKIEKLWWWQTLKRVGVPHIHGNLNCDAVVDVLPAPRRHDGEFLTPHHASRLYTTSRDSRL